MTRELTTDEQATNYVTMRHIERVRNLLNAMAVELLHRGELHDQSKLEPPEVEAFTSHTKRLSGMTYGSDEYREALREIRPAIEHHYANNRHHPEHFRWHCPICRGQFSDRQYEDAPQGPNDSGWRYCPECSGASLICESQLVLKPELGIGGMTLVDLLEMLCDWKAASERHDDGDIRRSIDINAERFRMDPQLVRVFRNTAEEMFRQC